MRLLAILLLTSLAAWGCAHTGPRSGAARGGEAAETGGPVRVEAGGSTRVRGGHYR